MTEEEAISYIESFAGAGIRLGLSRMRMFLAKLGNPENKVKIIHVAGTNGKGSICAILTQVLLEAGYTVGTYTSPHLQSYRERFMHNGKAISSIEFARLTEQMKPTIAEMEKTDYGVPTVFEILTAMGFQLFAERQVDVLVLEVGLGGRYDATNCILSPLVSIIGAIGFDHMEYLGNSLEEIATEKGGIIKKKCPTVLYNQSSVVYNVINEICQSKDSKLYCDREAEIHIIDRSLGGMRFEVAGKLVKGRFDLSLLGDHQAGNAATVLLACQVLESQGLALPEVAVKNGLKKATWRGRMDVVGRDPIILFDGAHNIDGVSALAKTLKQYFAEKDITLLFGALEDKQYEKMIYELLPIVNKIVFTQPKSQRALPTQRWEELFARENKQVFFCADGREAFYLARQKTAANGVLCCTGSLYLIGSLYSCLE